MSIDRAKFTAWLKAKPPGQVVGERWMALNCPVANFHNWPASGKPPRYQIKVIADDDEGCWAETQEGASSEVLAVPYWVVQFVRDIDEEIEDAGETVTARQALLVLDRMPSWA